LLALFGVAGVTWFGATQRAFEVAVRSALGASPPSILLVMMHNTMGCVCVGVALGAVCSVAVNRAFANLILAITRVEAVEVTLGVSLVLLLACAMTAFGAVFRLAEVDPSKVLRCL
jgi:ABC-type antimicrobial peptide transport system permease subunit